MMKNNSNIKLLMLVIPVALAGIVFSMFFLDENSHTSPTGVPQQSVFIPDSKKENTPSSKSEAYKQEQINNLKNQREQESSIVRSSDFFKEVASDNHDKEIIAEISIAEIYEQTISGTSSNQQVVQSNANTLRTTNKDNNRNWQSAVTARSEESSNIERLYSEAKNTHTRAEIYTEEIAATPVTSPYIIQHSIDTLLPTIEGKRKRNRSSISSISNLTLACIHGDQTVTSGSTVRMRLLETIEVNNITIPANTLFYGVVTINNDRLNIKVENIKYGNTISQVQYNIYDNDAIQGLNLPDNIKHELAKKSKESAIDNVDLSTAGSGTIGSIVTSGINTVKSVIQKEEGQIKVTLKANYKLFITSK